MTPRDLHRIAQDLATCPERTIEAALQARHLDATERTAVRIEIDACRTEKRIAASLATDQGYTPGAMATDTSVTPDLPPLGLEVARLFRRANLEPGRSYSQAEVDAALTRCDMDPTSRIALKAEMGSRGWLRASAAKHVKASWGDMSAKADERPQGKILLDATTGQPAVLRSRL